MQQATSIECGSEAQEVALSQVQTSKSGILIEKENQIDADAATQTPFSNETEQQPCTHLPPTTIKSEAQECTPSQIHTSQKDADAAIEFLSPAMSGKGGEEGEPTNPKTGMPDSSKMTILELILAKIEKIEQMAEEVKGSEPMIKQVSQLISNLFQIIERNSVHIRPLFQVQPG